MTYTHKEWVKQNKCAIMNVMLEALLYQEDLHSYKNRGFSILSWEQILNMKGGTAFATFFICLDVFHPAVIHDFFMLD